MKIYWYSVILSGFLGTCLGCSPSLNKSFVQDVVERSEVVSNAVWLSHEHILVNFIGADKIQSSHVEKDSVLKEMLPHLNELKKYKVTYFVDATPNYLGRDVQLLQEFSNKTGLKIITNTGLYGARNDLFIPKYAKESSSRELANNWIDEFKHGIDGTQIKPGFIKIGIDNAKHLSEMDRKLVEAACFTHLNTGLTIASHTGKAEGLWPQLDILKELGVSPQAFIWVHSQNEKIIENYKKVAKEGCWISLDGLGWNLEKHIDKLVYAKEQGFLEQVLISHDAGWYDPEKEEQTITSYTAIFSKLFPALKDRGFTQEDLNMLISKNPSRAFSIKIRKE